MGSNKTMVKENNNVDLNEAAKQSGEDSLFGAPRWELPIVRLEGQKGKFLKITKNPEGGSKIEELEDKIKGTTLNFRRTLGRFTDEESYFTTEHNSFNDRITLFIVKQKNDGTKSVMAIDEGTAKDVKEKDSKLKMTQIIYFLMGKEIVKLQVKGSSLKNFYEFRQEIKKKEGKHFFQFLLDITMEKITGKLGVYYTMNFAIAEEIKNSKLKLVVEKIKEVSEKLEQVDGYYKNRPSEKEEAEKIAKSMIDAVNEEPEDEIDVAELPFK